MTNADGFSVAVGTESVKHDVVWGENIYARRIVWQGDRGMAVE